MSFTIIEMSTTIAVARERLRIARNLIGQAIDVPWVTQAMVDHNNATCVQIELLDNALAEHTFNRQRTP